MDSTDYDFPRAWGLMSDEEKHDWFVRRRVWRQVNRQYDSGMWDQWTEERLSRGTEAGSVGSRFD